MAFSVWKLLVFSLATLSAVKGQLPEDNCTADGDSVCLSCSSLGTCVQGSDGGFEVELIQECADTEVCDSSFGNVCISLGPSITNCTCFENSTSTCIADLNNENAFVLCDAGGGTSEVCDPGLLDLAGCSCFNTTPSTTTLGAASTTLDSGIVSTSTTFEVSNTIESSTTLDSMTSDVSSTPVASTTIDSTTSDVSSITEASTTSDSTTLLVSSTPVASTTSEVLTTTGVTTCPECGFLDFSESDCSRYFYCADGDMIEGACPGVTCFDQATCLCII